MGYETILYDVQGPVATITLSRPDALNAINPQMTAELHAALEAADADTAIRVIALNGAGRAFSAGYDIGRRPDGKSMLDPTGMEAADFLKRWWAGDDATVRRLLHLWHFAEAEIGA